MGFRALPLVACNPKPEPSFEDFGLKFRDPTILYVDKNSRQVGDPANTFKILNLGCCPLYRDESTPY